VILPGEEGGRGILLLDKLKEGVQYICSGYIAYRYRERILRSCYGRKKQTPNELLPLTPAVFNILLSLADGEKHGYGIMLEVEANTKGQIKMGPGTLYGSIKRMLKAGMIEESDERPDPELDDQRRRYYRMTGLGRKVLGAEAERLESQVAVARGKNLLEGLFLEGES
jgi:DNA-binding PadR family transcriptional regulator